MAYEALASYLGMRDFVPHTEYCTATFADTKEKQIGTFQESSQGIQIWSIPREKRIRMITPTFQKNLINLQILDAICHELDHSLNNYYPTVDDNDSFCSVSAFDNGGAGAFSLTSGLYYKTYFGCNSLFSTENIYLLPFVDEEIAKRILTANFIGLRKVLTPYLKFLPIFFTWIRIKKLKKALSRHDLSFCSDDDWSKDTIDAELGGRYGNTYLCWLVNEWQDK